MSFPNPDKGPFEDENKEWARHVAATFVAGVTSEMLAAPGCDPAHAAIAHFQGFICCAFSDAMKRGDGEQIMGDILEQVRPFIQGLIDREVIAIFPGGEVRPTLTVLTGGKADA
ncbi:MAG: hypothetical protein E5Y73_11415 [Mesorhizobium sp.]|uniref:hypothetical protein n=1 Tax=Mesorhizobium sp. TaxID=1871066 RepID=UPI00121432C8|nr:hypothetical protein [Mesorhizobium sp.]TIL94520.1 MAG: hypothetical protein E5Y73_11415 [Mesorhizobium sp.]